MSGPLQDQLDAAMQELKLQQEKLSSIQQGLSKTTTSVTSKDRSLTVVIDAYGGVADIAFATERYRELDPKALSTELVTLIAAGRKEAEQKAVSALEPLMGTGELMRQSMIGGMDLDSMLSTLEAAAGMSPVKPARNIDE